MNKKIIILFSIMTCSALSASNNNALPTNNNIPANHENTGNTEKLLPTQKHIFHQGLPKKTIAPPTSTASGIKTPLKAPELSEQEIQKMKGILNGKPLLSKPTRILAALGLIVPVIVIQQETNCEVKDLIVPVAFGLNFLLLAYLQYKYDIIEEYYRKDLIEMTNKINNFYEENSKNSN